jgi:hypothetical protein
MLSAWCEFDRAEVSVPTGADSAIFLLAAELGRGRGVWRS